VFSYVERGYYGRQLARALDLFPRDQLLLLNSDELRREPARTMQSVCAFLGITANYGFQPRISRPAAAIDYPVSLTDADVTYLQRQFADETSRFSSLVPEFDTTNWAPLSIGG